jgi:hypothetical protein
VLENLDRIYLPLALPWLQEKERTEITTKLKGNGVAALFEDGTRSYVLPIVASIGKGVTAWTEPIEAALEKLITRTNAYAKVVWGHEIVHIAEDGVFISFI